MTATATNLAKQNSTSLIIYEDILIAVDDAFEDFTGYYKEEVYKRSVLIVLNELLRMKIDVNSLKIEQQEGPFIMFTKHNEVKEIYISIETCSDLGRKVLTFFERPNSKLNEEFVFLEQHFIDNYAGIAIFSVPDLILLKANQKYLDFVEYPFNNFENSIGHPIHKIIKGWTESSLESVLETVLKTKKSQFLKERVNKSCDRGITYWDTMITPVIKNGEFKYIYDYSMEVTDKVIAKNQLLEQSEIIRQQKEQLESIIENISDGLSIFDKNGKYIMFNTAAKRMFFPSYEYMEKTGEGYYQTEYLDMKGKKISHENIPASRVIRGEKFSSMRMKVIFPDKVLHIDVSGTPVYDNDGNFIMGLLCSRDVTQNFKDEELIIKQKEDLIKSELERNQILEKMIIMKDEFLSTISHEFRTPLNVINSAIQAMELLCRDELSLRAKKYIKSIRQNAFRQLRLVNNLLDITKAQSGKTKLYKENMDIVFITKSIVESVSLYAQQKRIKLKFVSTVKEKTIGIDEEKYERILLNLLSNAIKFTPEKKQITVKLSLKKDYVRIEVKDQGMGIPEDKQKVIFERFGQVDSSLTRQAEGTGIGLSLVKLLVNIMDGEISVKSEVGKGSSFIVLLPDKKVQESPSEKKLQDLTDNRLIQSIAIEFSDIYLS